MNRFRGMTAAVLAAALSIGGAAFAQGPRAGGPEGRAVTAVLVAAA